MPEQKSGLFISNCNGATKTFVSTEQERMYVLGMTSANKSNTYRCKQLWCPIGHPVLKRLHVACQ